MFDDLGTALNQLTDRECRRILLQLLISVRESEREQDPQNGERIISQARQLYHQVTDAKDVPSLSAEDLNQWHLVLSDSSKGSLKVGLNLLGANSRRVLSLSSDLSVGPLTHLEEEAGLRARGKWFRDHFQNRCEEENDDKLLENRINSLNAIPEQIPLTIWTANNAWEQTGLCLAVHVLKVRSNKIRVINVSDDYRKIFKERSDGDPLMYSGELSPEQFALLFRKYADAPLLDSEERSLRDRQWERLSVDPSVLRIFEDGKIKGVQPDYFDSSILRDARRLAGIPSLKTGIPCMRLVGEVIGRLRGQQWVKDFYILWRIQALVHSGALHVNKTSDEFMRLMRGQLLLGDKKPNA